MDAIENILTRRSVRRYADKPVSDGELRTILTAGMTGPSCVNARDWHFLVTRDRELLAKMAEAAGRAAAPLKSAPLGILVLEDLERAFQRAPDYWVIDASIAAENMILAAHALGIGSVWLGCWPQMERVERLRELFRLPETVVPHSLIAFGYPGEGDAEARGKGFYEEDRVHFDRW